MEKVTKTNALRMLDKAHIHYELRTYEWDENDLSGGHVAKQLGVNPASMYKTLVLSGDHTPHLVACIPVEENIDLKALARASGNKRVEMIHVKELMGLTGYIRGGCSPVGMKKQFPTYFQQELATLPQVILSAGQRGKQMVLAPADLLRVTGGQTADIIVHAPI